jgi:hypothetical protein
MEYNNMAEIIKDVAPGKKVAPAVQGKSSNKVRIYSKLMNDIKFIKWRTVTMPTGVVNSIPEDSCIIRGRNSIGFMAEVAQTEIDAHFWEYITTQYHDFDHIKSNNIFVSSSDSEAMKIAQDTDGNITLPLTEEVRKQKYETPTNLVTK